MTFPSAARRLVLGLAVVSFVATGCGGGGSDDDSAQPDAPAASAAPASGVIDPCSVLTVDEVSVVVGEPVEQQTDSTPYPGPACVYGFGGDPEVNHIAVTPIAQPSATGAEWLDNVIQSFADQEVSADSVVELDGLGEAAYSLVRQVHFFVDDTDWGILSSYFPANANPVDAAELESLARTAAGRVESQ